MHRVAGEKDAILAVAIGEQKVLPPRIAGEHLVFDGDADGALECPVHFLTRVDDRMQRPVSGRILHDQLRRLVVGHVVVPPLSRAIADRQTVEKLVAAIERLA